MAITMGDTNGVGPEILAKLLARPELMELCEPVVFGSADVLRKASAVVSVELCLREVPDVPPRGQCADAIPVIDWGYRAPAWNPGVLEAGASRCAVEWLKKAIACAQSGQVDGIVTCPVNKEGIQAAGYHYVGHTQILAELTASPDCRMCLFAGDIRVVHITSHCSLLEAVRQVTKDRIVHSIRVAHAALGRLELQRRRIAVAGLNPHAGEAGMLGREEITEILPAIELCRKEGIDCVGPYPPDTVFKRMVEGEFDLVIAMYHDQGHIPVKLIAMDQGVNVTLGIPIVRTSVDHGTAYDIAGTGEARADSLWAAIRLAVELVSSEEHPHD
ncbi:MAG TPA: 4-hydroxythreonine-4-phosphate dehydrogenase PdxA [Candidatus Hydrogenedentes bacterium]|nr:4-hydroxythreonine-4-phosphate dehydrogenase PdxA [Candidatus Hydrogenedentota bacterium]HQH50847.1 4-hydroxythreonine-4-phosphate dehydrogenase PdxA [Candidatus Hydrogenedentota bacterium]HQM50606.1 4-hydroxythreonine-4-phosphate dehydrogenase PdxA [Candidatus Hydrogenedentota bacterium]